MAGKFPLERGTYHGTTVGLVIESRAGREKISRRYGEGNLRYDVRVDHPEMCSLMEALHDSLNRCEREMGQGP